MFSLNCSLEGIVPLVSIFLTHCDGADSRACLSTSGKMDQWWHLMSFINLLRSNTLLVSFCLRTSFLFKMLWEWLSLHEPRLVQQRCWMFSVSFLQNTLTLLYGLPDDKFPQGVLTLIHLQPDWGLMRQSLGFCEVEATACVFTSLIHSAFLSFLQGVPLKSATHLHL